MACLILELTEKVVGCLNMLSDLLFEAQDLLVVFVLLSHFVFLQINSEGCHFLAE